MQIFLYPFIQKKSNAQSTFDQVLRQLGIVEKDYFGLEYEDEHKNQVSILWQIGKE